MTDPLKSDDSHNHKVQAISPGGPVQSLVAENGQTKVILGPLMNQDGSSTLDPVSSAAHALEHAGMGVSAFSLDLPNQILSVPPIDAPIITSGGTSTAISGGQVIGPEDASITYYGSTNLQYSNGSTYNLTGKLTTIEFMTDSGYFDVAIIPNNTDLTIFVDNKPSNAFAFWYGPSASKQYININFGAAFTASISTNILTVTAVSGGVLSIGQRVFGPGVASGTYIAAFGTGTGGAGTYRLSNSQTVSSSALNSAICKPRKITLQGLNLPFAGVVLYAGDAIWASNFPRRYMAFCGDSYSVGAGANAVGLSWTVQMARALGYQPMVDAIGGTGWLTSGSSSPLTRLNVDGANKLAYRRGGVNYPVSPTVHIAALGYNDAGGDMKLIAANMAAYYSASNVKPIFVGPWTPLGDTANLLSVRTAVQAKASTLGAKFIDIQGFVTATSAASLTGPDNVHPNQLGHDHLAYRIGSSALTAGLV